LSFWVVILKDYLGSLQFVFFFFFFFFFFYVCVCVSGRDQVGRNGLRRRADGTNSDARGRSIQNQIRKLCGGRAYTKSNQKIVTWNSGIFLIGPKSIQSTQNMFFICFWVFEFFFIILGHIGTILIDFEIFIVCV